MRCAAVTILVVLVACEGKKPATPVSGHGGSRKEQCAVYAAQEMTCVGMTEAGRGNEMYDLVYDTCIDPTADPDVTMALRRGASRGEALVEIDAMVACAQNKPASCDAYAACYGGSPGKPAP